MQVDLATIPTPQLAQIKNQLTQELSELTNSFAQLRGAQTKFRDCIASIRDGVAGKEEGSLIFIDLSKIIRPTPSEHLRLACNTPLINEQEPPFLSH
jgi:prefoldin alpha subunit